MYIDPGSGSMALQVMLAGALGLAVTFWRRIRQILAMLFSRQSGNKP